MRRIVIVIFFIIMFAFSFIIIRNNLNNNTSLSIDEKSDVVDEYVKFDDFNELGLKVAEKNGDWSKYHLSKSFLDKYNEKDGIFGDIQFDKVEYKPYHNGKYSFEDYSYLVLTQGKKKTAYIFTMRNGADGYDIIFGDTIELTDENGNELDARIVFDKDNYSSCFYSLSRGSEDERSIAVTDRFHRKYPYFLDLFEHYSPLEFNRIEFVSDKSSWDRKEAYFTVDSRLECIKREYEVKFTLDDSGYLDEAVVKCIKIEKYERESIIYPWSAYIFFINGNWTNLKMTEKFKSKFNSKRGCFSQIDSIDVDKWTLNSDSIDSYTHIMDYAFRDGTHRWYCEKYINDNEGNLDDVEYIPIEYYGIDIEEAKSIYLKEHNK